MRPLVSAREEHDASFRLPNVDVRILINKPHLLLPVIISNDTAPTLIILEHRLPLRIPSRPVRQVLQSMVIRIQCIHKRYVRRHEIERVLRDRRWDEAEVVENHI